MGRNTVNHKGISGVGTTVEIKLSVFFLSSEVYGRKVKIHWAATR